MSSTDDSSIPAGIARVLSRIKTRNPITGCDIWTGPTVGKGYGRTRFNGKKVLVHRLIWEYYRGPIPEGLQIDHLCGAKLCCNVDHLRLATARENSLADTSYSMGARNFRRLKCPKCGGEYSRFPNGVRYCAPCRGAATAAYQQWRRAEKAAGREGVKRGAVADHAAKVGAAERREQETKQCPACGNSFTAAYGQWSAFKTQRYCSRECADKHRWDSRKVDNCPKCGTAYSTFPGGKRYCQPCRNQKQRERRHAQSVE